MFSNKFAMAALAAAAISSAAVAVEISVSEQCKEVFTSMVGDEKLNACLPIASLIPFVNKEAISNAGSLNGIFKQLCSATCDQSLIDSYSGKLTSQCSADIEGVVQNPAKIFSSVLKMYTPLRKAACYVDDDKQFCLAKNILALKIDLSAGIPSPHEIYASATNVDVCTKCNQHMVGTFMDFMTKNPFTTFPITSEQKDKVVATMTEKCGAEYANGLPTCINAPFPELQRQVAPLSSASSASFNAVALFVAAAVVLGANN